MRRYWNKFLNWLIPRRRARLLAEIMKRDQELGLWDETFKTKERLKSVSKRYKITYCKDGYLPKEFDIYIYAKTTKEACEKFFNSVDPIYHDILRINVCQPK